MSNRARVTAAIALFAALCPISSVTAVEDRFASDPKLASDVSGIWLVLDRQGDHWVVATR
ncbi:MAG TPA: hypothetical protein VKG21_22815 [Casimicrobiaceae bacterium]|nr:hypothetical protein [Casimicrobiaceae bacterium]